MINYYTWHWAILMLNLVLINNDYKLKKELIFVMFDYIKNKDKLSLCLYLSQYYVYYSTH